MSGQTLSRPGQVLKLLLEASAPRSGQEMGALLGCSRAAVGKAVDVLRAQGFGIEARPNAGYLLLHEPPLPLPARLEALLPTGGLGLPLWYFSEIDSTNLEARRRAEQGAPHGACLVAEYQSAGRGRLDRRWSAPAGSCLLFSLLLRPDMALAEVFGLTNLMAVALCRAIEDQCGLEPAIKWPNDVFLEGRKLAGILSEFTCRAERLDHVVVGVGLNVNLTPQDLAHLPAPAASLLAASGQTWDRAPLLAAIMREASDLYGQLLAGGRQRLTAEYNQRSWLQDRMVEVRQGDQVLSGWARGVAEDGALVLEQATGQTTLIRHGDVSVLSVDHVILKP
ncbi:MAG: biotin--[acetyl-CoA-carboxylase] ligase [Desulfarculus sp.]|nr:biotin--[acetyl-CoA-carboxylase] ligase [Desulfarculus sp.]